MQLVQRALYLNHAPCCAEPDEDGILGGQAVKPPVFQRMLPAAMGSAQGPGRIDRNAVTLSLVAFKHKKHYNILFFERNKGLPLVAGGGRRNGFDMDTSSGRCPAHRISAHLAQAGDDPDREGPVPAARVPVDDRQPQERSA